MPAQPDCLLSLVALTDGQTNASCFPLASDAPASYTTTDTGLYLDQADGLSLPLTGFLSGAASPLWLKLATMRNRAVVLLRTDLARVATQRRQMAHTWRGVLGQPTWTSTAAAGTPCLLPLQTWGVPDTVLRLLAVTLLTDVPVSGAQVLLNGQPVGAPFDSSQGKVRFAEPIIVPLDNQTHTLSIVLPADVRPRNNTLTCGCGSTRVLNPYLRNLVVGGAGLSFEADVYCTSDVLCDAVQRGFQAKQHLAEALLCKTVELLAIERLTAAPLTSQSQQYSPDDWKFLQARYQKLYEERVAFLGSAAGELDYAHSPCYICQNGPFQLVKSY